MIGILLEVMWVAQIISLIAHQLDQYSSLFTGYGNTLLTIGILIIFVVLGEYFQDLDLIFSMSSTHPRTNGQHPEIAFVGTFNRSDVCGGEVRVMHYIEIILSIYYKYKLCVYA